MKKLNEDWLNIKEFIGDGSQELFCYLPIGEADRVAYNKQVAEYGHKDAVGATHWAIFVTIPDELLGNDSAAYGTKFIPKIVDGKILDADGDYIDIEDITWWDMSVGACIEQESETYVYCPEFTFDWWQATYTMNQVYAICEALKILMQEDRYVVDNNAEWNRVWDLGEYPEHVFTAK